MLTLLSLALAGPVEVEQARDHLLLGRPDQAFVLLREETARSEAPQVWLPYLASCDAVGLGPACRSETAVRGEASADLALIVRWHERLGSRTPAAVEGEGELARAARGELAGLRLPDAATEHFGQLARERPESVAELATTWLDTHPEHPDVLLPMFGTDVPPTPSIGKFRKLLEKRGKKALKRIERPEVAYRWHRVLRGIHSEIAPAWASRIEALGAERPTSRLPYDRAEQVALAVDVLDGRAPVPDDIPADREGVALKVATRAREAGRLQDGIAVLAALQADTPELNVSLALAQLQLDTGALEEARAEADRALGLAVGPWQTDRAGLDRIGRRVAVAEALAARGEASLQQNDQLGAVVDLMIANQLAFQPTRAGALERAMEQGRYGLEQVKATLDTPARPAQEVALDTARKALEAGDPTTVVEATTQAIQVLSLPTHRRARLTATLPSRGELASAFALRGAAQQALGNTDAARIDLTIAVLLQPWTASPDWWEALAGLRDDDFSVLARAMFEQTGENVSRAPRALTGLPATEAVTEAVSTALVSEWMRGHEELEAPPTGVKITRARVIPVRKRSGGGSGGRPVVNRPFPPMALSMDGGVVSVEPGRVHLISFVRTDSPSSALLLTELRLLARKMRKQGIDVASLGVSIDNEAAALERVPAGDRERWGAVTWAPELGERFGVRAVPTTWLVDASGIARFVHVGYLGPSVYEDEIRYVNAH